MTIIEVAAGGIEALQREVLVLRWCLGVACASWCVLFWFWTRLVRSVRASPSDFEEWVREEQKKRQKRQP